MATKPKPSTPTLRPGGSICRIKLDTIADIKAELGRIYRTAKSRRMEWHHASRACHILSTIARLIEGSDLEARIAALEEILGPADKPDDARPPRHHRH